MHIVIIGNGISGITTARHVRKHSQARITVISDESAHFFSRTALMYVYMGHLTFAQTKPYEDSFWKKNRIDLLKGRVVEVDPEHRQLLLADGSSLDYDKLVIATGSVPNTFGWPGQDLEGVQGLYSKQDLELLERNAPDRKHCRRAVIVGGGLIGIELAEMLRSREIPVTFLVRETSFWNGVLPEGDSAMINEHIREHHIDLRLETSLREILPGEDGRARAVVTGSGETIPCDLVGLTAGVRPNIGFLEGSGIETDKGVLVNRYLETSIPEIYAIGDCAQQREPIGNRKAVEAVWYTGRMMGETLARTLTGQRLAYNPGHWFNSAKFFDIEYQTYGWVQPQALRGPGEAHFHWRHPKQKICLTLAFEKDSRRVLGINALGMRLRHEVVDQWLEDGLTAADAIGSLETALFDPEFHRDLLPGIRRHFEPVKSNAV